MGSANDEAGFRWTMGGWPGAIQDGQNSIDGVAFNFTMVDILARGLHNAKVILKYHIKRLIMSIQAFVLYMAESKWSWMCDIPRTFAAKGLKDPRGTLLLVITHPEIVRAEDQISPVKIYISLLAMCFGMEAPLHWIPKSHNVLLAYMLCILCTVRHHFPAQACSI